MNVKNILWEVAKGNKMRALPILSFPAAQKLGVSVKELVSDASLQAKAMKLIAEETDTVASLSFMDLSVEAEAFGADIHLSENEVPAVVGQLVSCEEEANGLLVPSLDSGRARTFIEAVKKAKELITSKPVIAGMIGPYSLAGRLMDVTEIMYACFDEPETVHTVLKKVTDYLISYGKAMKEAGADGVMMAEPLAGILSPDMADEFSVPYVKKIFDSLKDDDFTVIYHNCGNSVPAMLDEIYSQEADAYHFGNAVDMLEILKKTPSDILVMGNVDPAGEFANGTPESISYATKELIAKCSDFDNFVISSGCDIPAHAKWENINAFFEAVEKGK